MIPSNRMDSVQYRSDGRTVRRSGADMMQGNDPVRIDQDIPASLVNIPPRLPQLLPLHHSLQIGPPCFRSPNVPEGSGEHPVLPVRFAGVVDQKRPGKGSFGGVAAGEKVVLERDHRDFHVSPGEFLFPITQLRDMRPAGQSAEVAMENQQQPTTAVVREKVNPAAAVPKFERRGGFSGQVVHDALLILRVPPSRLRVGPCPAGSSPRRGPASGRGRSRFWLSGSGPPPRAGYPRTGIHGTSPCRALPGRALPPGTGRCIFRNSIPGSTGNSPGDPCRAVLWEEGSGR